MASVVIKALEQDHYDQWLSLYHGYADHYRATLTDDGIKTTWGWLMDEDHPLTGLVPLDGQQLIGLAHFRAMPSPLRGAEIGFLDDLFVDPASRGQQAGELMLMALKEIAADEGWAIVRWITRDNNYRARSLYDRHAIKTDWNTYEMLPG